MNINLSTSGTHLMASAQHKLAVAGKEMAQLPVQKNEVGSKDFNSKDLIKPVLSLKQAEFEGSAAAKLIGANKSSIGSIIDIKA